MLPRKAYVAFAIIVFVLFSTWLAWQRVKLSMEKLPMKWDSIQQLVRIVAYAGGGYMFGDAVANGAEYQAAVGGALQVGAFAWWYAWERKR